MVIHHTCTLLTETKGDEAVFPPVTLDVTN